MQDGQKLLQTLAVQVRNHLEHFVPQYDGATERRATERIIDPKYENSNVGD